MRGVNISDITEVDGTRIITTGKGVVVILSTDGRKEIRKPDNSSTEIFPDGTRRIVSDNGEVVEILPPEKSPLNVVSTSPEDAAKLLSNFAHTPFVLDYLRYHSIEGFYVGLKFSDAKKTQRDSKTVWSGSEIRRQRRQ